MSPPASTPIVKNIAVLAAGLALFLIVLWLPLPEGMTESGRRLLAVVALMGVWEAVEQGYDTDVSGEARDLAGFSRGRRGSAWYKTDRQDLP